MLSRTATGSTSYLASVPTNTSINGPVGAIGSVTSPWQQSEAGVAHQQITEVANKRIATLEYLRKTYVTARGAVPGHGA
jgi:hypothetical protein